MTEVSKGPDRDIDTATHEPVGALTCGGAAGTRAVAGGVRRGVALAGRHCMPPRAPGHHLARSSGFDDRRCCPDVRQTDGDGAGCVCVCVVWQAGAVPHHLNGC